jgi:exopolysaccharide biosynthesis protein
MFFRWAALLLLLLLPVAAPCAIITNAWLPAFKGVDYTTGQADASEPRQQKVFAFRVNLREPTIEFFSTSANTNGGMETLGQTTTTFVNTSQVSLGVNANFFSPVTTIPNDPRALSGLAISRGQIVSTYDNGYPAMLITPGNTASIITAAKLDYSPYWTAVAGSDRILINGVVQLASCTNDFCNANPRSAIGYSSDGRYFFIIVIDGRQPGWSDGATLYETGQWLLRLGAWNGLNLDGGGSSALAKLQDGAALLLNKPSGGVQRVDGNHLGLFAQPAAPVVVVPPRSTNSGLGQSAAFSVTAGGTTSLRYQWRFSGTNIAGATLSTYTRSNLQLSQFGQYSVFITNSTGSVTSQPALLVCSNTPTAPRITLLDLSRSPPQINVVAAQGRAYDVQSSSNLVQWTTLTNVFNTETSFQVSDPAPRSSAALYYRVRWLAP